MKLPAGTIIAPEKLSDYLLRPREDHDKSGFLALAGYARSDAVRLEADIRTQLLSLDAISAGQTPYGEKFVIRGALTGPNGRRAEDLFGVDGGKSEWLGQIHHVISGRDMRFPLYSRVALAVDIPAEGIRRGDIATVVEYHAAAASTEEPGYSVEVFNAIGETLAVLTLPESHLEALRRDEVLSVRSRAPHAA